MRFGEISQARMWMWRAAIHLTGPVMAQFFGSAWIWIRIALPEISWLDWRKAYVTLFNSTK
jgi:hypothetical protein